MTFYRAATFINCFVAGRLSMRAAWRAQFCLRSPSFRFDSGLRRLAKLSSTAAQSLFRLLGYPMATDSPVQRFPQSSAINFALILSTDGF